MKEFFCFYFSFSVGRWRRHIRLGSNHNHVHRYIRLRVEKTMNNEYDSSNIFSFLFFEINCG